MAKTETKADGTSAAPVYKSAAEALNAYRKIAEECKRVAVSIEKKRPELLKQVEAQLSKMGLDLGAMKARKRAAWAAYEALRGPVKTEAEIHGGKAPEENDGESLEQEPTEAPPIILSSNSEPEKPAAAAIVETGEGAGGEGGGEKTSETNPAAPAAA